MHADGRNVDGAPENFQGWRHQDTADFNSKQVFPFKGIPLESNTLSQSSLPHLHALYQESFRDSPHRHPRGHPPGHPEVVYVFKPDPLEEPLEHGKDGEKKKKSHAASSGESRNNFSTAVFLSARNCQTLGGAMTFCRVLVHCRAQIMWGKPVV